MDTLVKKARKFAKDKHKDQLDDNDYPYFVHLEQVYKILKQVTTDPALLSAGFLHDCVEDQGVSWLELAIEFGGDVADLVLEVTHEGKKDNVGYYFPRLHTQKGITLKFADRLSNVSRMQSWDEERKAQYLKKSKFWKDGSER